MFRAFRVFGLDDGQLSDGFSADPLEEPFVPGTELGRRHRLRTLSHKP